MLAKAMSQSIYGSKLQPELSAVASAVCAYLSTSAQIQSINFVTGPGAGTYTGNVVGLIPSMMSSLMLAKAASTGMIGRHTRLLFDAISFGVCQTLLTTAIAQGTVIGGGPGVGQGKIIGLIPSILQQLIFANLSGKHLMGSKTINLCSAIAFGVCTHIQSSAIVNTTCIGVFSPPPVGPIPIPTAPGPGFLV